MWSLNRKKSKSLINIFLKSKEKNIQLDFYRENGEVLLQIFKGYDVSLWEVDLEFLKNDNIVYQLLFHKDKTNNDGNLKRFEDSFMYSNFKKVDFYNQEAYFYVQSINLPKELENKISEILNEVYDIGLDQIYLILIA